MRGFSERHNYLLAAGRASFGYIVSIYLPPFFIFRQRRRSRAGQACRRHFLFQAGRRQSRLPPACRHQPQLPPEMPPPPVIAMPFVLNIVNIFFE